MILLLALFVQDQVDNPEFKAWASFKPGSTVTYKVQLTGQEATGEQKTTLKEVGGTELVLVVTSPSGTVERKVAAKIPAAQLKRLGEGEEEIEVAGKKMATKWADLETTNEAGVTFRFKVWAADEIPGRAARLQMFSKGAVFATMTASTWEKK